jgi:hypothetical protein
MGELWECNEEAGKGLDTIHQVVSYILLKVLQTVFIVVRQSVCNPLVVGVL